MLTGRKAPPPHADSVPEIVTLTDCRPFAIFLRSCSLQSATNLIRGYENFGEVARLNTIHRCKYFSAENNSKKVYDSVVSQLFKLSVYAGSDEEQI